DYATDQSPAEWRVRSGWLIQSGATNVTDLRASALLYTRGQIADFRLQAILKTDSQACGIIFGGCSWSKDTSARADPKETASAWNAGMMAASKCSAYMAKPIRQTGRSASRSCDKARAWR